MSSFSKSVTVDLNQKLGLIAINRDGVKKQKQKAIESGDQGLVNLYNLELRRLAKSQEITRSMFSLY